MRVSSKKGHLEHGVLKLTQITIGITTGLKGGRLVLYVSVLNIRPPASVR